jgi:hypothetical protein
MMGKDPDWIAEKNVLQRDMINFSFWLLSKIIFLFMVFMYPVASWFIDSSEIRKMIKQAWRGFKNMEDEEDDE